MSVASWELRKRVPASGPIRSRILVIAEAPGENEENKGAPLVGASGHLLRETMAAVGLNLNDYRKTNVFSIRPVNNQLDEFMLNRKEFDALGDSFRGRFSDRVLARIRDPIVKARYAHPYFATELDRLGTEIVESQPNLILALGGTALWATTGQIGISKSRGTICAGTAIASGFKVLPTFHPSAILHQWSLRPVLAADLMKAKRESETNEFHRQTRRIYFPDGPKDLWDFVSKHRVLGVDVETSHRQITSIAFSRSRTDCICVPIVTESGVAVHPPDIESAYWRVIRRICNSTDHRLVFQNGVYDIQYLWARHGIPVRSAAEDTMLLAHAMYPELTKSLGFLGSIYTNEPSWKQLRQKAKIETMKGDDE